MRIESWNGYGYACSQTPAGFFQMNNKDYSVGIGFINMEVCSYSWYQSYYNSVSTVSVCSTSCNFR